MRYSPLLCIGCYLLSILPVAYATPPSEPILRPNLTMHSAPIRRIDTDAKEEFAVSASDDKTVRVWRLPSLDLVRVLRPPIGEGNEGKLYAVAISPDGQLVATGGWTGYEWDKNYSIYLFDRATGTLTARLTGLPSVIAHLAFSADGRYLAAALGAGEGIRVYQLSTASPRLVAEDRDYGADSYWVEFDRSGRLVSSCDDGYLRLYDSTFQLIHKQTVRGGKEPASVRFHPDGTRLAVGFVDSTAVTLVSGRDLSFIEQRDTAGIDNGNLVLVAWSSTGQTVLAGGSYHVGGLTPILRWQAKGTARTQTIGVLDTIMGLRSLADNRVLVGAADPALVLLNKNLQPLAMQGAALADFRGLLDGFGIAADGLQVNFAYQLGGKSPASFSLAEFSLNNAPRAALQSPRTQSNRLNIANWFNNTKPTLNGKALPLEQYEISRSLAIAADKQHFLLGTEWYLRYFDAQGQQGWEKPAPGIAWAVNLSANGLAVAAFGDGTIRWYRARDGEELLALLPHPDKKRWVVWTPQGYYAASGGGESLVGWHVNNGADNAADFFEIGQFRDKYYRPEVITALLETQDIQQALAQVPEKRKPAPPLQQVLPPVLDLISPIAGTTFTDTDLEIRYRVRSSTDAPVASIKVYLDSTRVDTSLAAELDREHRQIIKLPARNVMLTLFALNKHGQSTPVTIPLQWGGSTQEIFKPALYMLAVGVNQYEDATYLPSLDFTDRDARLLAEEMKKQKGKLFRDVNIKLLINPTRDEITRGLTWLEKETTSRDVAILTLSGHGIKDTNGRYYFLPQNARTEDLKTTGVSRDDIRDTLSAIAGKRILFLDSCHSGQVMKDKGIKSGDVNELSNELADAENGVVVFTASSGRQVSVESPEWQHGAFTKAIIEGLQGKADYARDGAITLSELEVYVTQRVKELTKGTQTPSMVKPDGVPDFAIAAP